MITDKNRDFLTQYGSAKHIDKLLDDRDLDPHAIIKNPNFNDRHHEKLFHNGRTTANKIAVIQSKRFPSSLRHDAMTHENPTIRGVFASREDITDEEFNHLKHDENKGVVHSLVDEYATPEQFDSRISDIIKNGPDSARSVVAEIHNLPIHHVDDILKSNDDSAIGNIAHHHVNLTPNHLKTLSEHPDWIVRSKLAMNREVPDHIREKLLSDTDERVRPSMGPRKL